VVGRVHWDHWLVWRALACKEPVVDVSPCVMAVHQNHDYGYHPQGKHGVWHDEESQRNHQLAGGWKHFRTIADATAILRADGLKSNTKRYFSALGRYSKQAGRVLLFDVWQPIEFFLLGITRPLRRVLRPRDMGLPRSRENA
jgi:hypothetical protein